MKYFFKNQFNITFLRIIEQTVSFIWRFKVLLGSIICRYIKLHPSKGNKISWGNCKGGEIGAIDKKVKFDPILYKVLLGNKEQPQQSRQQLLPLGMLGIYHRNSDGDIKPFLG